MSSALTDASVDTVSTVTLRPATVADADVCGPIIYEAFRALAERHDFPPDFPSAEAATGLARAFTDHASIHGVVAEAGGRGIVGSNFLIALDDVAGVGPITIDPTFQARGIGRRLMQWVVDQGRDLPGIRLVQDAFNTASMSLYASLGFEAREPLALLVGTPASALPSGYEAHDLRDEDLDACAALCRSVHGIARTNELRLCVNAGHRPIVLRRDGRIVAYASAPTFWPLNHGVAETEQDLRALLCTAGALRGERLSLLLPIRQAPLFRWCLAEGFRVVKPMTLMTMGQYQEPRGAFYPAVFY